MNRLKMIRIAAAACLAAAAAGCSDGKDGEQNKVAAVPGAAVPGAAGQHGGHGGHGAPSAADEEALRAETARLFPDGNDRGWAQLVRVQAHGATPPETPLEKLAPEVRNELTRQIALTREVARKYPTAKAALAGGYLRTGPFVPGQGVHYMINKVRPDLDGILTDEEILSPPTLIYADLSPDAPIAGFMYLSRFADGKEQPQGFAGPDDHWHGHTNLCRGPTGPDGVIEYLNAPDGSLMEPEACKARGGFPHSPRNSMVHVWSVPQFASQLGMFSALNPALKCPDGSYRVKAGDDDVTTLCQAGRRPKA